MHLLLGQMETAACLPRSKRTDEGAYSFIQLLCRRWGLFWIFVYKNDIFEYTIEKDPKFKYLNELNHIFKVWTVIGCTGNIVDIDQNVLAAPVKNI